MYNADQPMFPYTESINGKADQQHHGLTKREYFAGLALQGLLSVYDSGENSIVPNEENVKYMVKLSVTAADELLEQLDQ